MNKLKTTMLTLVLVLATLGSGCWVAPDPGTVTVQTIEGQGITKIIHSGDFVYSYNTFWDAYHTVNMTDVTTAPIIVQAQSKDNARLSLGIQATYRLKPNDNIIIEHLGQYGLDEKTRDAKFNTVLTGHISTETRNAINVYDAYELMANQGAIQGAIQDRLKLILDTQLRSELVSVQLTSAPDFENDNIETAASQVVANQKLKEAATAAQDAARIETETKQIQARTFENPKMYALELQKLKVEEAANWAKHNGTLIFGGGNSPLMLNVGQ